MLFFTLEGWVKRKTCIIVPCSCRPQGKPRLSLPSVAPEGPCGTTGRSAAPAAPAFACERPYAFFAIDTRAPARRFAGGIRARAQPVSRPNPPRKQYSPAFRTRWICGLLHAPGFVATADAPRSCELSPGPALGPSARVAGVCAPGAFKNRNPRRRPEPGIVADHRIPLPRHEHARGAPLNGAGCGQNIPTRMKVNQLRK